MYDHAIKNGFTTDEDKYLNSITERQDLCLNITQVSDEKVRDLIADGAAEVNKSLMLCLTPDKFLKKGGYNKHTQKKKIKMILTRKK